MDVSGDLDETMHLCQQASLVVQRYGVTIQLLSGGPLQSLVNWTSVTPANFVLNFYVNHGIFIAKVKKLKTKKIKNKT